jgi:cytochrome c556
MLAFVTSACSSGQEQDVRPAPPAAVAAAPTPVLSFNELMVTMVDNAGHVLWDAEKDEFAPRNDADWMELQNHATQVAAASTLIQVAGTGPTDAVWARDPRWREFSQTMAEAAMSGRRAATQKNLKGVVAANTALVQSCEGCHDAFKPDLPTEGIAHQRPHSESHPGNR